MSVALKQISFPVHYLEIAETLIRLRGGDPVSLYRACGIDPDCVFDSNATINGEQARTMIEATLQSCLPGEPPSLQVLRHFPLTANGTLGMLIIASETVGDALDTALQYYPLVIPAFEMTRDTLPSGARVRLRQVVDFGSAINDALVEVVVGVFRNISPYVDGQDLSMKVRFRHAPGGDERLYAEFFGEPVEFNAEVDEFFVPSEVLRQRLLTSNRPTRAALQALLLRQAGAEGQLRPVTQRVRRIMSLSLNGGVLPSAERIADELAMSVRTLSRRLQEEGVTLIGLAEQIRIERAERLLLTTSRPINLVGRQSGFQDASSFSRAFKRVTGMTPNELRERSGPSSRR